MFNLIIIFVFFVGLVIYKCFGYIYNVDNLIVYFYYFVLDKLFVFFNIGDIIVVNESSGFIEIVIRIYKIDEVEYLEMRLL